MHLYEGEILSILGPSGCGKTTLLRIIAGLESPYQGTIFLNNEEIFGPDTNIEPAKRNIGMIFQDYALFPHLSVEKNILFGISHLDEKTQSENLERVQKLTRLEGLLERYPHELSGGQQQRVAIARTLATRPAVLLMDEPFSNLDASLRLTVRMEMEEILRESNTATIFVTHDREEAFSIANKLVVMINGKIFQMDNPSNIYNLPNNIEVAKLVADCNFIKGSIQNKEVVTDIGSFRYESTNKQISDKQIVNTLIRPDDFIITYDPNGSFKITAREFHGPYSISTVLSYQYGFSLKFRDQQNVSFPMGTNVNLIKTNNRNLVVFPK